MSPTVNPTLLKVTPSQVFKQVSDARCVVVSSQAPLSPSALYPFDLIWTVILNAWAGVPKHFYELCLLKLTNLPVSFFLESQACGLPWLLSRQCVDSTWDRWRTVSLQVFRVITRLYWSTMQVISMLEWGFRPPDAQHLTLSVIKLHPGVICSDLHLW